MSGSQINVMAHCESVWRQVQSDAIKMFNVHCTLINQLTATNFFWPFWRSIWFDLFGQSISCVECYISRSREYSFFFVPSLNFSFLLFLRKNSILIHLSCICILIVVQTCLAKRNFIERLHNIRRLFSSGCLFFRLVYTLSCVNNKFVCYESAIFHDVANVFTCRWNKNIHNISHLSINMNKLVYVVGR